MLASKGGSLPIVQYLVSIGVDVSAQDNDGSTVLMLASKGSRLPIVHSLLSHGANVDQRKIKIK